MYRQGRIHSTCCKQCSVRLDGSHQRNSRVSSCFSLAARTGAGFVASGLLLASGLLAREVRGL